MTTPLHERDDPPVLGAGPGRRVKRREIKCRRSRLSCLVSSLIPSGKGGEEEFLDSVPVSFFRRIYGRLGGRQG